MYIALKSEIDIEVIFLLFSLSVSDRYVKIQASLFLSQHVHTHTILYTTNIRTITSNRCDSFLAPISQHVSGFFESYRVTKKYKLKKKEEATTVKSRNSLG